MFSLICQALCRQFHYRNITRLCFGCQGMRVLTFQKSQHFESLTTSDSDDNPVIL